MVKAFGANNLVTTNRRGELLTPRYTRLYSTLTAKHIATLANPIV